MKTIPYAVGSFLLVMFLASSSMAQAQRTFVSGLGNDSNPCSRTAPCRSFTQAISQTTSSGEVYVLDSAGYATFTITQPISIVAPPGVTAGISVFLGQDGITINAGASDIVILRGLTLNSQGTHGSGILCITAGTLHVENCVVNGFSAGIAPEAGLLVRGAGTVEVKDSIFRGNLSGIVLQPTSGTVMATIDQVRLEGSFIGLLVREGVKATARNCVASADQIGFDCISATGTAAELTIENCVASNNTTVGAQAGSLSTGVATLRVSNSTVTDNVTGITNNGSPAVVLSRGNNTVEGNGTDTMGTIGSYTAK